MRNQIFKFAIGLLFLTCSTHSFGDSKNIGKGKKMYATIKTTSGDIKVELFSDKAPNTVKNFVDLATGAKEWINPQDRKPQKNRPLYNGTVFHRVIKGFMIQGGDPLGTGQGGPGYRFADEFHPELKHEKYTLSMANAGPNSNGSQFFITVAATPWLDNHHSVFGRVVDPASQSVIDKIANTATGPNDRPRDPITITSIEISH